MLHINLPTPSTALEALTAVEAYLHYVCTGYDHLLQTKIKLLETQGTSRETVKYGKLTLTYFTRIIKQPLKIILMIPPEWFYNT